MPDSETEGEIVSSFLDFVQSGSFPQSEDVASAEVTNDALPKIIQELTTARETVRSKISGISRGIASGVDDWIAEATRLQQDITRSKAISREIVEKAEYAKKLQAEQDDALQKKRLLEEELSFNTQLQQTLQQLRQAASDLAQGQEHLMNGALEAAHTQLESARSIVANIPAANRTSASDLLSQRTKRLQSSLSESVKTLWNLHFCVDKNEQSFEVRQEIQPNSSSPSISSTTMVEMSSKLNILEPMILQMCRDVDLAILKPLFSGSGGSISSRLSVQSNKLAVIKSNSRTTGFDALENVLGFVTYLSDNLPPLISGVLSDALMPSVLTKLIEKFLTPSVPVSVQAIDDFSTLLERARQLSQHLADINWSGSDELQEWIDDAPQIWLARKRGACLIALRKIMSDKMRQQHVVERVETQALPPRQEPEANAPTDDDAWDENWGEEQQTPVEAEESEDTSAWEAEEDGERNNRENRGEEDGDDWGWGGEDPTSPRAIKAPSEPKQTPAQNGLPGSDKGMQQEVTLRENYTITGIPEEIYKMVWQIADDMKTLEQPQYTSATIVPSTSELASLAGLGLAGYRALAPVYYEQIDNGSLYLYNDCTRLGELLKQSMNDGDEIFQKNLEDSVVALSVFSKRIYDKELDSQRTILGDLLDGAQGFASCTTAPLAAECATAVTTTCDRFRQLHGQWRPILPKSALFQSLGNLLASAIDKIIVDVEDLSDISDEESKKLKAFCDQVMELNALFTQETDSGEKKDLTSLCVSNWIRFQYLAEILESSLADIRWMWKEGDLRLDFEPSEIVDLIEALFAESSHRRDAIAEIRKG